MPADLKRSLEKGVLQLTTTSDDGRNTMDDAWWERLASALDDASGDRNVRAVILTGEGSSFCAGANLRNIGKSDLARSFEESSLARLLKCLMVFPKPLLAAVHGSAIGGGATLLLHFDLVVAASDTVFRLPFASLGIVPELGSSYLLPRAAGSRLASELILLGEPFDAKRAQEAGFVNAVVAPGEVLAFTRKWADKLAAMPPRSVSASKQLLQESQRVALSEAIAREGKLLEVTLSSEELKEAAAAFMEKRPPDFSRFF